MIGRSFVPGLGGGALPLSLFPLMFWVLCGFFLLSRVEDVLFPFSAIMGCCVLWLMQVAAPHPTQWPKMFVHGGERARRALCLLSTW